jgi:carboxyl-terminal processing protease
VEDKNLSGGSNYKQPKKKSKVGIYTLAGLFVASSLFSSGWLFGSGRLSFRSNSIIPISTDNRQAPREGIDELYRQIVDNYDGTTTDEAFLNGQKSGLADAVGDPYTEFFTEDETKEFNESLNGTFEGIGAELGKEGSFVIIVSPIKGAPAEKAGIQAQDIITKIDGEDATDISISEAVSRIRGPKGESVTLTIIRAGEEKEITIVRDTITIESVEWELSDKTGIITISRFGDDTIALTKKAAQELKDQGATSIILDLRGNPGGLLDAAVGVSSVWLPKGSTVLEEKRNGQVVQTFKTTTQPILEGVPTVILINGGSASASEIVAGALHDNKAATLVGTKTFGKGSVQRVIPLSAGGSLKVTIARWFTPEGKNIDKEGIAPDTVVEITPEDREAERDPQLDAAKSQLQN